MNIKILQAENSIENVDKSVISALYNAHINGDISLEVDNNNQKVGLVGSITAPAGYAILVSTLNSAYPKFHVTVNSEYISFEDANVELILLNVGLGDGVGITVLAANNAAFTNSTFKNNTTITSFNEFPYFTRANTNPPAKLFSGCSNLLEIDLSNTTTISNMEFAGSGIIDINAPLLTSLIEYAFNGCSLLLTVTDLGAVTEIPIRCFLGSPNLTSVNLPSNTKYIRTLAFGETSLMLLLTINLSNVTHVDEKAFSNCKYLDIDASELSNLVSIGLRSFNWCKKIHGELNIPKLQSIGAYSFEGCKKITKVKCLGKIISIPEGFMRKHSEEVPELVEVYLPYECTSIGNFAFDEDTNLTTIKQYTLSVDNWVEGETPVYGDITRVTSFGNSCFNNCTTLSLSTTVIKNATSIGNSAFRHCNSLTGVIDLPNLTSLNQSSFEGCTGITDITNLGSVTDIPHYCFSGCSNLSSLSISSTITSIGNYAFLNCSNLTGAFSFPNLLVLGGLSFEGCSKITSLDFTGSTFTKAENRAFEGCTQLSKIKFPTTVTNLVERWGRYLPSPLYITGLDNVNSHSAYNWDLYDHTILNPIKTSLTTGGCVIGCSNNNIVIRVHSYYEPARTTTMQNSQVFYGAPKSTQFVYNCLGGSGSFTIGLLYYKDITSFGDATFYRCNIENLVINNVTPPTLNNSDTTFSGEGYWLNWGNSIFGNLNASSDSLLQEHANIGTLWVPDSAVATYQADPLYSMLTIKGINTKTNGVDYDLPRYANFAAWEAAEEAAVAQGGHAPLGLIEAWM